MRRETRWVIVGDTGLYTGQWLTRADAIAEHVSKKLSGLWFDDIQFSDISEFAANGKLDAEQRRAWRYLRSHGDRAVWATIEWHA